MVGSSLAIAEPLVTSSTGNAYVNEESDLETYIVLLKQQEGELFAESKDLESWYRSFLPADTLNSNQPRLLHYYRHVVIGFAAKVTADEAKAMEMREELECLLRQENGKGNVSSMQHYATTSFYWFEKGTGNDMLDRDQHGTHTAGTAAGSPVKGAILFGQANGTAIGMAPLAHLAMYKVSARGNKAGESEIQAATDAAIDDGVDVLPLSLGLDSYTFYDDVVAIGAYAAIQKGIFFSCSTGNSGQSYRSLSNEAPWILTVGASTLDREIRATVLLGNNTELNGEYLFQPKDFPSSLLPLVYAGANGNASSASRQKGSLRVVDVKGKIVLWEGGPETVSKGKEVKRNGGSTMIVMNYENEGFVIALDLDNRVLPATRELQGRLGN
ncbi:hypothetical protein GH714_026708 [Hevea brasiliensis]|uniref:Peptidase S8/S53 domain-containing protein n=1 Tax=Hevea brasiliensis TaxID=3981 RepID=A0A6A6LVJ5_HEVBR|nr:hypothetical protein GH714_026708 [Hevea brasiliensis]